MTQGDGYEGSIRRVWSARAAFAALVVCGLGAGAAAQAGAPGPWAWEGLPARYAESPLVEAATGAEVFGEAAAKALADRGVPLGVRLYAAVQAGVAPGGGPAVGHTRAEVYLSRLTGARPGPGTPAPVGALGYDHLLVAAVLRRFDLWQAPGGVGWGEVDLGSAPLPVARAAGESLEWAERAVRKAPRSEAARLVYAALAADYGYAEQACGVLGPVWRGEVRRDIDEALATAMRAAILPLLGSGCDPAEPFVRVPAHRWRRRGVAPWTGYLSAERREGYVRRYRACLAGSAGTAAPGTTVAMLEGASDRLDCLVALGADVLYDIYGPFPVWDVSARSREGWRKLLAGAARAVGRLTLDTVCADLYPGGCGSMAPVEGAEAAAAFVEGTIRRVLSVEQGAPGR